MILAPVARLRALRLLGSALAGDPLQIDVATWRTLAELATEHGLAAALWVSLGPNQPPDDVGDALRAAYHRNLGRSMRIRSELRAAIVALNAADICPVPLKGAFHLLEGTFAQPAERVMADIDLLVTPSDLPAATSVMERSGYEARPWPFGYHHEIPMVPARPGVTIELHRELGTARLTAVLPTAEYLDGCRPVERDGLRYGSARPTHVVVHNVLHAQVSDRNHHVFGLPLRQLHTFSAFVRRRGDEIDWDEVAETMDAQRTLPILAGYLDLAAAVFGLRPPIALRSSRWRHYACAVNAAFGGRAGDLVRNLESAFAAEYLHGRYGQRPLTPLRVHHARVVWSERGRAALREVSASRWR